jgi:hypothetical protein
MWIFEPELDSVAAGSASLHLTFFGISAGALVAFWITLATVTIDDPMTYGAFVGLLAVSVIGSLYFGVRGVSDYVAAQKKIKELKQGRRASVS